MASRDFAGLHGSLLYACSVISCSLRIKSSAIANHCGFLLVFIAFVFAGKLPATIMTSRSTCNSQAAAFDALISPADINPLNPSTSAANSSLPSTSSSEPPAASQSPSSDQPFSHLFGLRCKCCQASASGRASFESARDACS